MARRLLMFEEDDEGHTEQGDGEEFAFEKEQEEEGTTVVGSV